MRERAAGGLIDHFKAHICHPTGGNSEDLGSSVGQINDASAGEGAAVIDAHNRSATVVEVGHPNLRSEGKVAVGCREGAGTENFTTGRAVAKEPWAIPTGLADLNASR